MKRLFLAAAAVLTFTFTFSISAQVTNVVTNAVASAATNAVPALGAESLPVSKQQFWTLFISVATPLIVGFIYKAVPKVPKIVIPLLTPFVGLVLGAAMNWLQKANLGWVDMAQAGALAVFVREVVNQASQTQMMQKVFNPASAAPLAPPNAVIAAARGVPLPPPVPDPQLIAAFTPPALPGERPVVPPPPAS